MPAPCALLGCDPARTSATSLLGPTKAPTVAWQYSTNSVVNGGVVLGGGGLLFVGSGDGVMHALDTLAAGALKWSYQTQGAIAGTAAILSDGSVVFGSGDGSVYLLDGDTGALLDKFTTGGAVSSSPAADTLDNVYIGSADQNLYAFAVQVPAAAQQAGSGTAGLKLVGLWQAPLQGPVLASPALSLANNMVFLADNNQNFFVFNATTGAQLWTYFATSNPVTAVFGLGRVYLSARWSVFCFDIFNGQKPLWTYGNNPMTLGLGAPALSTLGATPVLYVPQGNEDGVVALNALTGAVLWTLDRLVLNNNFVDAVSVDGAGFVYVSYGVGVAALVGSSGSLQWNSVLPASPVAFGSVVGPQQKLYFGAQSGIVYCYH